MAIKEKKMGKIEAANCLFYLGGEGLKGWLKARPG